MVSKSPKETKEKDMKNWKPILNVVTHFHRILASTCLLTVWGGIQGAQAPNIVLFLIDDMGIMDTSLPVSYTHLTLPTKA